MQQPPEQPFRKYICVICGFIYNEEEGFPEEGIEPGTRWDDVPVTWSCPDCGATKDDFELLEDESKRFNDYQDYNGDQQ